MRTDRERIPDLLNSINLNTFDIIFILRIAIKAKKGRGHVKPIESNSLFHNQNCFRLPCFHDRLVRPNLQIQHNQKGNLYQNMVTNFVIIVNRLRLSYADFTFPNIFYGTQGYQCDNQGSRD